MGQSVRDESLGLVVAFVVVDVNVDHRRRDVRRREERQRARHYFRRDNLDVVMHFYRRRSALVVKIFIRDSLVFIIYSLVLFDRRRRLRREGSSVGVSIKYLLI